MEHPATTQMPFLPFVDKMIDIFKFNRNHTWMRAFKHPMPKPSYIWTTFKAKLAQTFISRCWSRKQEKLKKEKQMKKLRRCAWKRRLLSNCKLTRTARRFHKAREVAKEYIKVSFHGKWVSGGKDLSTSGSYTPAFCKALLECYESNLEVVDRQGPAALGNTMGTKITVSLQKMGYTIDWNGVIPRPMQPDAEASQIQISKRPRWASGTLSARALPQSSARRILQILRNS